MQVSQNPPRPTADPSRVPKIAAARASDICPHFELTGPAARLLDDAMTPLQFVRKLIDTECFTDAVLLLAHALPKREAVWWSCLCARDALEAGTPAPALTALSAAEAWVYKPTEEARQAAGAAAGAVDTGSPCGWPALAAFWAGGDIAPPGTTVKIAPAEHMSAKAVSAAITLAATKSHGETVAQIFKRYVTQGVDIAEGGSGRLPGAKS